MFWVLIEVLTQSSASVAEGCRYGPFYRVFCSPNYSSYQPTCSYRVEAVEKCVAGASTGVTSSSHQTVEVEGFLNPIGGGVVHRHRNHRRQDVSHLFCRFFRYPLHT